MSQLLLWLFLFIILPDKALRSVVSRERAVTPVIMDIQGFTSVLAKVKRFVRWETANSISKSGVMCVVFISVLVLMSKPINLWSSGKCQCPWKCPSGCTELDWTSWRLFFKPLRCVGKNDDACKMDAYQGTGGGGEQVSWLWFREGRPCLTEGALL